MVGRGQRRACLAGPSRRGSRGTQSGVSSLGLVWSTQRRALEARLGVLFSVPEAAQTSLPIRALLAMDVPHFFLQYVGNKSHQQAWKTSGELGCVVGLFPREGRAGHFFPTRAENIPAQQHSEVPSQHCVSHNIALNECIKILVMARGFPTSESVNGQQTFLPAWMGELPFLLGFSSAFDIVSHFCGGFEGWVERY